MSVLLLAMDTSSAAITAAVHDGSRVVAESTAHGAMLHGELLGIQIEAALAAAGAAPRDLTEVVVGVGPGPFTGLRVGITLGSTMAAALGIPVHGACSLDGLAASARKAGVEGAFAVVSDARRKEVYFAIYDEAGLRMGEPAVALPSVAAARIVDAIGVVPVVGAGAVAYPANFPHVVGPSLPSAGALAEVVIREHAAGRDLLPPTPLYLRRPDAEASIQRKRVTP